MIHNEIKPEVKIIATGYSESTVSLEDGDIMLPPGYYMEVEINGAEFVVPIDIKTYTGIDNALYAETVIDGPTEEIGIQMDLLNTAHA